MQVSVLGLGRMGHALALRLLDTDHEVTVWNRTPGRADDLVGRGAREARSPGEAAVASPVVFLSLTADDAVRSVVTGEHGIAAVILGDARRVLVDTTTVSPDTSRAMAGAVGNRFVAAPILGGPKAVEKGVARYLVAGPADELAVLAPVLDDLSDNRRVVGADPGLATTVKILANYLLMTGLASVAEVVATGQALGLDDAFLRSILTGSPLVAPALENRLDQLVEHRHQGWFPTTLGAKDVGLALELARSAGLDLPLGDVVWRRYQEAGEAGWGDADISAVIELFHPPR